MAQVKKIKELSLNELIKWSPNNDKLIKKNPMLRIAIIGLKDMIFTHGAGTAILVWDINKYELPEEILNLEYEIGEINEKSKS